MLVRKSQVLLFGGPVGAGAARTLSKSPRRRFALIVQPRTGTLPRCPTERLLVSPFLALIVGACFCFCFAFCSQEEEQQDEAVEEDKEQYEELEQA